ncbi:cyclic peptide export ABC transporter [uncultured Nostoc sp.]|uniref:cyclic peptide export ABC transporter n=1 Tax=uncultured Nostoc sp. TaxID=340711 RepID=UPI0035CA01E1
MNLIRSLLRNSPRIVVLAIVISLLSGLSNASLITLIHKALNFSGVVTSLLGWSFAGLALFSLLTAVTSQLLLSHLYRQAVFDLQMHLSRQIINAPLRQLEEIGNAPLLAILIDDVTAIGNSLLPILPLCSDTVIVAVCLAYLCWLSWSMFLATLGVIILGGISYKILIKKGEKSLLLARDEISVLFDHFRALTDGIKELKLHSHRRTAFFNKILRPTAASIQRRFFVWSAFYSLTNTWGRFLLLFVTGLLLFVLPTLVKINTQTLTGYILTLLYIRSMLFSIMGSLPAISRANIAFQKIEALGLQLASTSDENLITQPNSQLSFKHLNLVNITHCYYREREDNNFTLGPINLSFSPGELIFLIGDNGSGKTTFAKLLTGLYIPETGEMYLDGQPINDQNRDWYRQHFSVVFSDFYLFDSLLGLETSELDKQAQDYLVQLHLDHKVKVKDGVLSTTALSSGQRKRLALLTAYLEDRPFYVFDEWTSNQDPLFKDIFYTQILPMLQAKGKAVLAISHDDKYFHLASRILKLDYGHLS